MTGNQKKSPWELAIHERLCSTELLEVKRYVEGAALCTRNIANGERTKNCMKARGVVEITLTACFSPVFCFFLKTLSSILPDSIFRLLPKTSS